MKKGGAPLSFSEMAKRPGNPQAVRRIPFPEKTIAQTNRPRAFFKVSSSVVDPFIFDILVRIRIRGPIPLRIFCRYRTFTSFFKAKKSKRSRNQGFAYYFCLMMEGSGSVSLTNGSGSSRMTLVSFLLDPGPCELNQFGSGSEIFPSVINFLNSSTSITLTEYKYTIHCTLT